MYILPELLEGLGGKCQLRDVAGDLRSPVQHHQEHRASWGASNGLRGARGKRHLLWCHIIVLWGLLCSVGGDTLGSLWSLLWRRGACCPFTLGEVASEEVVAASLALWIAAAMRSISGLTGVPAKVRSSSWSPYCFRCTVYLFSSGTFLNFLIVWKERKRHISKNCKEGQISTKLWGVV